MYHILVHSQNYYHKQQIEEHYPVVVKNVYGNLVLDVHLPNHTSRQHALDLKHQLSHKTGATTVVQTTDFELAQSHI